MVARKLLAFAVALAAVLAAPGAAIAQTITGPAGVVSSNPDRGPHFSFKQPPLEPGEIMVGDMILLPDRRRSPDKSEVRAGFNLPVYEARLWEFGIIPVAFEPGMPQAGKDKFYAACSMWASAGVICMPRIAEPTYIRVQTSADGCWSKVGMQEYGAQALNLQDPGCWSADTIAHEIGHAFGMMHEQSRPDRDSYVRILWENIEAGQEHNFDIEVNGLKIGPYDFTSLMHYARSDFAKSSDLDTILPRAGYESFASTMGKVTAPSSGDVNAMTFMYGLPPMTYADYYYDFAVFPIDRGEALEAMTAIDGYYTAPRGLNRNNGLSINGRPDFLGLAAWFFDIYVNSRYNGLDEIGARFNVMANITQTDEWRGKHPGQAMAAPFALRNMLPFSRSELLAVMEALDNFYRAPEGLQRPQGLSLNGSPDFQGIATWIVDIYMTARLVGFSPTDSFTLVVYQIMQTDEWRAKH
jgi:hypothetical protein